MNNKMIAVFFGGAIALLAIVFIYGMQSTPNSVPPAQTPLQSERAPAETTGSQAGGGIPNANPDTPSGARPATLGSTGGNQGNAPATTTPISPGDGGSQAPK